ncbi:MAG TPA: NAD(P)-dependent oxidoreductase [Solirubrobacteraceae bacterium]|nr:NAD(P)-dependent oxidoreductase [Solirubrobacteraceae bacterium]
MSERVAFLGLGIMGSRMAANLVRAGYELSVWNRTRATAETFWAEHPAAVLADTPAQAAAGAGIVVTMVVDGPQVEAVLLGEDGAAAATAAGGLVVDCSTIGPSATREIASRLAERGIGMVDAPVTGSSPRAQDGTLTIMAGGEPADFERARPLLDVMGQTVVHCGPLGHGQMVKLINNAVAATNAATLGQALVLGARAGVDLDALVEVMRAGSGASTMLELKAEPMRTHDYTTLFKVERSGSGEEVRELKPYFKLEHMLKDVRLCLEEGQAVGAPFAFAALTREILSAAMGRGHGDHDFASLIDVLEGEAGIRLDGTDAAGR